MYTYNDYSGMGTGLTIALLIVYLIIMLVSLVASIVVIIAQWKLFNKAGQHGWAAIIPFYNMWVMCDMVFENKILWFILLFIPFASFVSAIAIIIGFAKSFGKGVGFGIFTLFFPFIGLPILAFGKAEYEGKAFTSGN